MSSISVKLPQKIHQKLLKQVIEDGYGMRGKSKWLNEGLRRFLSLDYFPELVELADGMEGLTDPISFRLQPEVVLAIDEGVLKVRKEYPGLEGVRSKIVRASILQRLVRSCPPGGQV